MVISNSNKHIAPYWCEEPSLTPGLNQLGIRNVSEQLFTVLLSGLNNVSLRIRYYSFYCWIIKQFYEGKQTVIDKDFNIFIRRAELLVALINATHSDHSGIPGINFAAEKVDSGVDYFSLKEGADIGLGKNTYWANSGGILRQYYAASLVEMGLIGQNEKYTSIYNITKGEGYISGLMLADRFAESIGSEGDSFLEIMQRGSVTKNELIRLQKVFRMKHLDAGNKERATLQRMLLQDDSPIQIGSSTHRRKTIMYILEYLYRSKCRLTAIGFSRYMYDTYFNTDDLTAWGWYAYYLDNNWQYQFTQIFHDILVRLKLGDRQWIKVEDVSDEMIRKVISDFNINPDLTLKEFIYSLDDIKRNYETAEAIRNLMTYFRDNISKLSESKMHYQELGIHSENFCDFLKSVDANEESKGCKYLKKLIEDIIYRHYRVSFRKMLQTQKSTQKFALENGCLRFIDNWDATNTSPRIDTMRNFLIDLNIIETKESFDGLTDLGLKLLNDLNKGNPAA